MFVYWKVQERMDWGAPTLSWRHPQRQLLSLAGLCIAGTCLQGWPLWLAILRGLACLSPGLQETLGQCSVWGMCLSQKWSQGQGCGYSFYNRIFFFEYAIYSHGTKFKSLKYRGAPPTLFPNFPSWSSLFFMCAVEKILRQREYRYHGVVMLNR